MRAKQIGNTVAAQRIGKEKVRRGSVLALERAAALLDFFQRAGEALRVARGERAGGVGQVLAAARYRQLDERGDDRRHPK